MKRGALIAVGGSAALFGLVAALTAFRPPLQTFDTLLSAARGHDVPAFVEGEDDPGVLRRAAVHYDLVCAECHGSPADPERGRHLVLVPPAPRLHDRLTDWTPALLYRVVHDGVPGSAMPGWTAPGRSDEVWAMVAFLLRLPDLDADEYAKVAAMDTVAEDDTVAICARCHLRDLDSAPRLGIQAPAYLADALQAFRSGARKSGFMQEVATELDAEAIEELAERMSGEAREIAAELGADHRLEWQPRPVGRGLSWLSRKRGVSGVPPPCGAIPKLPRNSASPLHGRRPRARRRTLGRAHASRLGRVDRSRDRRAGRLVLTPIARHSSGRA